MMKKLLLLVFGLSFLFVSYATAQNKVVVIPLLEEKVIQITYPCTGPDEVMSNGRCWKDRNLGASQAATSSTDAAAYGDLYQWGRLGDGHQNRTSSTTATNSANDVPGHSNFITDSSSPYYWRVPKNDILWQGLGGVNNPCPQGFRLPTGAEWQTEMDSWSSRDAAGAFASHLKLVVGGTRDVFGYVYAVGSGGTYWSSTVYGSSARHLTFSSGHAYVSSSYRVGGFSVRCIKD